MLEKVVFHFPVLISLNYRYLFIQVTLSAYYVISTARAWGHWNTKDSLLRALSIEEEANACIIFLQIMHTLCRLRWCVHNAWTTQRSATLC